MGTSRYVSESNTLKISYCLKWNDFIKKLHYFTCNIIQFKSSFIYIFMKQKQIGDIIFTCCIPIALSYDTILFWLSHTLIICETKLI
jgi:hypothetical protein